MSNRNPTEGAQIHPSLDAKRKPLTASLSGAEQDQADKKPDNNDASGQTPPARLEAQAQKKNAVFRGLDTLKQQCITRPKDLVILALLIAVLAFAFGHYYDVWTAPSVEEPRFPFGGQRDPDEVRKEILADCIPFERSGGGR